MEQQNKPERRKLSTSPELQKKLEERAKKRLQSQLEAEWVAIAEFGLYFGWEAIMAVLSDEISIELMETLLTSARKIDTKHDYKNAESAFLAFISANQKNPAESFKQNTKAYLKEIE